MLKAALLLFLVLVFLAASRLTPQLHLLPALPWPLLPPLPLLPWALLPWALLPPLPLLPWDLLPPLPLLPWPSEWPPHSHPP